MRHDAIALVGSWLEAVTLDTAEHRINDEMTKSRERDIGVGLGADAEPCEMTRISLHEGAHAVVGHITGCRVTRACVRRDGSGVVEFEEVEPHSVASQLMATVRSLAGVLAELIHGQVDMGRKFALKTSSDILAARRQIQNLQAAVPEWNLTEDTFARLAYCTVSSNWDAIVRVGEVLRVSGELDGNTIAALCGPIH